MIVVRINGGLGNQMFQYAFLEYIKKNNEEAIVELAIYFNYIDKFKGLFDKIVVIKGKKEIEDKKVIEKD